MGATAALGTKFKRWDASLSTPAFVDIADITGISGPSPTRDTIDTTTLDTVGGYRTFIGSLRDAGTIQLSMNWTRTGLDAFKADFESSDAVDFQIAFPDTDSTLMEFSGIVTEMPLEFTVDDKITMDVTIKISGPVTVS